MKFLACLLTLPFCLISSEKWESTQLVWNFGISASCNVGFPEDPENYFLDEPVLDPQKYANIKSGDILWLQPHLVPEFYKRVLPHIKVPFVLVISDGDSSFPSDCLAVESEVEGFLSNEYLIRVFVQNADYQGPSQKVSPIPIGIDFHTVSYKGQAGGWGMVGSPKKQEACLLDHLRKALPTSQRKLRAFIDFQHSDTMHASFKRYLQFGEDRTSIFKKLVTTGMVDHGKWMNRAQLWETKRDYAFSISPHGNGYDCHRTWEDLALGCIVIVKSSPLDSLYKGLPVVIIKDWEEVTEENFQKWIIEYGDVSVNPSYREKLTNQYWIRKIKNAAKS